MTPHKLTPGECDSVYTELVMPDAARAAMACPDCVGDPIAVVDGDTLHILESHDPTCPTWLRLKAAERQA